MSYVALGHPPALQHHVAGLIFWRSPNNKSETEDSQLEPSAPPFLSYNEGEASSKTKNKKPSTATTADFFFESTTSTLFFFIFIYISIYTRADIRYAHEY
jgi:hypothetical protein